MNSPRTRILRIGLAALLPAFATAAFAQQVSSQGTASSDAASAPRLQLSRDADGEVVQLSIFEVTADQDKGYLASSSMSGTRLNSKIEDLPASISVVTKQQLLDLSLADINDVFMYEANTEGIYQWTSFTVDRGNVSDDVADNPQGATRMRGLTGANIARGGFASLLPVDSYNIDQIEITRGPNSNIFGLGGAGGTVNVVGSKASLTQRKTTLSARVDSYGGYRGSFDFNRVLWRNMLAVRLLGVYEEKGFVREPSADTTRRLQTAMTFRPWKNTTLRGSFESYRNFNSRPNSTTPRDMVSDWIASGRPTWDPTTSTVHFGDGRPALVNVAENTEATVFPYGLNVTETGFTGRPSWYIDNGKVEYYAINRMPNSTSATPANIGGAQRLLQNGTRLARASVAAANPLEFTPGVTDRSLYDWTSVNLMAPNWSKVRGETMNVELEQYFLATQRQTLALQAGWYRENMNTYSRAFLGKSDGGKMQVYLDINERLLDGSPNPYFLRPYIGGTEPTFRQAPQSNDNYRAIVGYQLDLTNEKGWLKHLGRQRVAYYGEYRQLYGGSLGYRDSIVSNEAWMNVADPKFTRNSASFRVYPRYYVGDDKGYNVDYAPARLGAPYGSYDFNYYDGINKRWISEPVEFGEYYYANRLNKRLLGTYGGIWQGYFLNDRIIPTLGVRRDNNRTREGNSAGAPTDLTNGFYDMTPMYSFGQYEWVQRKGKTETKGLVVKPLSWLNLLYNQSNSFQPSSLSYDVYGQPLPDPRGETKDYGFQINLFRNRLSIRAMQYETYDFGKGSSEINTIVQRAVRLDADGNASGGDPDLEAFLIGEIDAKYPTWTQTQKDAEILRLMGVDPNFIDSHRNKTHGDASNSRSKGKEIEINYNPTPFWTLRAMVTQSKAFNAMMSPALQEYVNSRLPVWTTVRGPNSGNLWWKTTIGSITPETWYTQNVLANMKLAIASQGKPRPQTREWRVNFITNFKLSGITSHRLLKAIDVGGAVRWEDRGAIGFYGAAPDADGVVRSLDPDKPVWDKSRAYFDVNAGYTFKYSPSAPRTRIQVNVRNLFEDGRLQPVAVNPDGRPWAFRIVDPRQLFLTVTMDF